MSIYLNNFERTLRDILQREMSINDAEEAIQEIRFGIYGDFYHKISPTVHVDKNGNEYEKYPNMNDILNAYYSDDYSKVKIR